jgi:hypothetical protein
MESIDGEDIKGDDDTSLKEDQAKDDDDEEEEKGRTLIERIRSDVFSYRNNTWQDST